MTNTEQIRKVQEALQYLYGELDYAADNYPKGEVRINRKIFLECLDKIEKLTPLTEALLKDLEAGWVMVPGEPTQGSVSEMCSHRFIKQLIEGKPNWLSPGIGVRMHRAYKAAIKAAPKSEVAKVMANKDKQST